MRGLLLTASSAAAPLKPALPWSRQQLIRLVQRASSRQDAQTQHDLLQSFVHQQLRPGSMSEPEALKTLLALSAPLREHEQATAKAWQAFKDETDLLFDFGPEDVDPTTLGRQENAGKPEPSSTSTVLPSFEWVVEYSELGTSVDLRERSEVHLVDGLFWQLSALAPPSGGIMVGLDAANSPDDEDFKGERRAEISVALVSQLDVNRSVVYGPVMATFTEDEGYGVHFLKTKEGADESVEEDDECDCFPDDVAPSDGKDLYDRAAGWLVDGKVKLRATVRRLDSA